MPKRDSLHHQPPESVHRLLCAAINNKRLIEFHYKECRRIAEPHDYGVIDGMKKLLAYQVQGESQSGRLPAWRWAEVDGINRVRVLQEKFAGARPVSSGSHIKWDCRYASVSVPGKDPC
jgi:hypothetical protein